MRVYLFDCLLQLYLSCVVCFMFHFWIACLLTLFCARARARTHVRMCVCAQKNIFGNMIGLSVCILNYLYVCVYTHVSVMRILYQ